MSNSTTWFMEADFRPPRRDYAKMVKIPEKGDIVAHAYVHLTNGRTRV